MGLMKNFFRQTRKPEVRKLEMMGFEDVQLIKTDSGKFMEPGEAGWMGLSGSAILYGRK